MGILGELHAEGHTIIIVTHDQVEAMTMSTRVAVMDQGRALQVAPPRELFARPADVTVATFIGTPAMNIIPATVVETPSGPAIELLGRQIQVAAQYRATLQGLQRVEVGIRPQAVRLVEPGGDLVVGHVFLREPLGLEDEVLVEMADGTRLKVVTPTGEEFTEGTSVGLEMSTSDLFVFHPESKVVVCLGIAP
jgi:ABC-type sugar transport system ATPase subunit